MIVEPTDAMKAAGSLTSILDGWTDKSKNSIYAFMAVISDDQYIVDIRHFKGRPNAENPNKAGERELEQSCLKFDQCVVITTDNPSTRLREFNKDDGVTRGLVPFCESRWYSTIQVSHGVDRCEASFYNCYTASEHNALKENVRVALDNPPHFQDNKILIEALQPILDSIAVVERNCSPLGTLMISFITIHTRIKAAVRNGNPLVPIITTMLSKTVKKFDEPVYFIALWLNPYWTKFNLSGEKFIVRD
ncbi:hypothetical protein K3495_g6793 [Podosphaera aphanis]|nr:hypothetical protein K3495_g6793 [Podosphaera aphanis]